MKKVIIQSKIDIIIAAKGNKLPVHFDFKVFCAFRFWILIVISPSQSDSSRIESCSVNRLQIVLSHWLDSVFDSVNVFSYANSTVNGWLKRLLRNAYFWIINLFLSIYIFVAFLIPFCSVTSNPIFYWFYWFLTRIARHETIAKKDSAKDFRVKWNETLKSVFGELYKKWILIWIWIKIKKWVSLEQILAPLWCGRSHRKGFECLLGKCEEIARRQFSFQLRRKLANCRYIRKTKRLEQWSNKVELSQICSA